MTKVMSKMQVTHNMEVEGGFLDALAELTARFLPVIAKTVLSAIGVGALSGLASSGMQKAMGSEMGPTSSNGLFLKKGGCVCQIETDGSGLYLSPSSGTGLETEKAGWPI